LVTTNRSKSGPPKRQKEQTNKQNINKELQRGAMVIATAMELKDRGFEFHQQGVCNHLGRSLYITLLLLGT
jgi:hypothetical protein